MSQVINLKGQRFGRLVVIEKFYDTEHQYKNRNARWICQCDCGNQKIIVGTDLRNGKTQSCGCLHKEQLSKKLGLDLIGKQFGKLTIIKQLPSENKRTMWLCQCECGNTTIARSWDLQNGDKLSCGCIKSYGESLIHKILTNLNYQFKTEYKFNDLKSNEGGYLRFDFAIFKNNQLYALIEYDGEQHFNITSGWNNNEYHKQLIIRDQIKNDYCQSHNIPLIRFNYLMLKNNLITENLIKEKLEDCKNV